jgi:hypothetical protein
MCEDIEKDSEIPSQLFISNVIYRLSVPTSTQKSTLKINAFWVESENEPLHDLTLVFSIYKVLVFV